MERLLFLRLARCQPRRFAFAQQCQRAIDQVECLPRLHRLLVGAARLALKPFASPLQAFEIGERQFGFDGLDIGDGIDAAFDVGDIGVFEAANDMRDRVDFANIGKELIA
jgi:hypothetical protein